MLSFDEIAVGDKVWYASRGGVSVWEIREKSEGQYVYAKSEGMWESGGWLGECYFRTELEALQHRKELILREIRGIEDREVELRGEPCD